LLINLDLVFPLPEESLSAYLGQKSEILVIEDQDGFLEEQLKMHLFNSLDATISGKENFPVWGELNLEMVEEFFRNKHNFPDKESFLPALELQIPERLGTFCEGCPHRTVFFVLDKIIKELPGIIGGDIGCSSLPPFRADWLMCMNAGIGISQGISHLNNGQIVFSTGGDGSFFHAGLLSLQSAVINKINLIHLVLDNKSVAMTGHQQSPTANKKFKARKLLKSIGVDRVYRLKAKQVKKLEKIIRKEAFGQGVRVLWIDGQCSRLSNKFRDFKIKTIEPKIKNSICGDCRVCYSEFACPAIIQITEKEGLEIDLNTCMRCGACKEVCPEAAIGISYLDAMKNLLKIR
jgi:indolepyruvate ferredoxin oxidoreductase, alpha subunit